MSSAGITYDRVREMGRNVVELDVRAVNTKHESVIRELYSEAKEVRRKAKRYTSVELSRDKVTSRACDATINALQGSGFVHVIFTYSITQCSTTEL
jgi:hypothetical protein